MCATNSSGQNRKGGLFAFELGLHGREEVFDLLDMTVCGVFVDVLSQDGLRLIQLVTAMVNLSTQHSGIGDGVAAWKAGFKLIQLGESLDELLLAGETEREVVVAQVGLTFTVFRIEFDYLLKMGDGLKIVVLV